MPVIPIEIPELMSHRARSAGESGVRWLTNLAELLGEIEKRWRLQVTDQMSGGTEALVFAVTQVGRPAVLKMAVPGSLFREARTLQLADGIGYAKMLEYDGARDAMLLERLGGRLADSGFSIQKQIEIICRTLKSAWREISDWSGLVTGAEKADLQADFIATLWEQLRPPCAAAVRDLALDYARRRKRAYDPASSYLIHGDAHIRNTLLAGEKSSPGSGQYKFVDPDGLFAEPALDLSISLREWRDELLAGDTLALGRKRCALLGELAGIDGEAIWQWGLIERLMVCIDSGAERKGE